WMDPIASGDDVRLTWQIAPRWLQPGAGPAGVGKVLTNAVPAATIAPPSWTVTGPPSATAPVTVWLQSAVVAPAAKLQVSRVERPPLSGTRTASAWAPGGGVAVGLAVGVSV